MCPSMIGPRSCQRRRAASDFRMNPPLRVATSTASDWLATLFGRFFEGLALREDLRAMTHLFGLKTPFIVNASYPSLGPGRQAVL